MTDIDQFDIFSLVLGSEKQRIIPNRILHTADDRFQSFIAIIANTWYCVACLVGESGERN